MGLNWKRQEIRWLEDALAKRDVYLTQLEQENAEARRLVEGMRDHCCSECMAWQDRSDDVTCFFDDTRAFLEERK